LGSLENREERLSFSKAISSNIRAMLIAPSLTNWWGGYMKPPFSSKPATPPFLCSSLAIPTLPTLSHSTPIPYLLRYSSTRLELETAVNILLGQVRVLLVGPVGE